MCRSFDTNRNSNDVFFVSSIEIKPNIIDFEIKRPSIFRNLLMALTFLSAGEWTSPSRYLIKYLHIAASWHPFIHCVSAEELVTSEPFVLVSDDVRIMHLNLILTIVTWVSILPLTLFQSLICIMLIFTRKCQHQITLNLILLIYLFSVRFRPPFEETS